jgi:SAM-dependent methyltransferase
MWAMLRAFNPLALLRLIGDWRRMVRVHYLYAAIDSGLLDALPASRDELIDKLEVKREEMLDGLLGVGLSLKELKLKNDVYRIKGKRSKSMISKKGDPLRALVEANVTYYAIAYRNYAARLRGGPKGTELDECGSIVSRLSALGESLIRLFVKDMVKKQPFVRILDVGCGEGVYLKAAYDANRNADGVGIDINPAVVDHAKRNIETWGISDRFSVVCGDIFDPPLEITGKFDLITLYNIVYYFDERERMALFVILKGMLNKGGVLAIVTSTYEPGADLLSANLNLAISSSEGFVPLPKIDDLMLQLMRVGYRHVEAKRIIRGASQYGIVAT